MGIKPIMLNRRDKAIEEFKKEVNYTKEDVLNIIDECLRKKGIDGEAILVNIKQQPINYEEIKNKYNTKAKEHIIFIQFVKTGHIAVVGAGMDIGFLRNENYGTWRVIRELPRIEWDDEEVIIVPVKGLDTKSVGIKNVDNILHCRNGVEQCIGEYLIEKNIPILNYYQHWNYSESYWKKCKNNNYNIG